VRITEAWRAEVRGGLPETPAARRARLSADYGIPAYDAQVLTLDKAVADYFEAAARQVTTPKAVANWVMTDLLRELGATGRTIAESPVSADHLAELVRLIEREVINSRIAKDVFAEMVAGGQPPGAIVREKGWEQVTDSGAIAGLVTAAIAANPKAVAQYREGKRNALQFLVGQVMRTSKGKANPQQVVELLERTLQG
jgi:aspartyl-tRNA(Asn)/glutamyl-tRNA(Gln) amidotransferase subunit B